MAASSTGATNPDTTFTGAPIAVVSLPISSAEALRALLRTREAEVGGYSPRRQEEAPRGMR